MKLFFPDSCWRKELISSSAFLYFHNEKFTFTLPPSTTTFLAGANPTNFLRYIDEQNPVWRNAFYKFANFSSGFRRSYKETSQIIEPLRKDSFKTIVLSYPRGDEAWNSGQDLIASSALSFDEIAALIDPFSAADELYSHIFLEKFLEFYAADQTPEDLAAFGAAQFSQSETVSLRRVDWKPLYDYCSALFTQSSLEEILTTAYMFRISILKEIPRVLLSNPNMVHFLASLPFDAIQPAEHIDLDVVAWEIFRQLTSARLDPISQQAIETVQHLRTKHSAEIDALKRRCFSLAKELSEETSLIKLQERVATHIRGNVESEIQALLRLNNRATRDFLDSVFSDEKTWAGIGAFLYGVMQGGPLISASAAIYSLSSVASKVVKTAAQRHQKLEASDYALIYRMSN